MGICAVFRIKDGNIMFVGKQFSKGYMYSEYTYEPGTYDNTFQPISNYLDDDRDCGITLFTSEESAHSFINGSSDKKYMYVIPFDRLCGFLDQQSKK